MREVERTVLRALEVGRPEGLNVIGYGEITPVIGWPPSSPERALKRLPVFDDLERLETYEATFRSYLARLKGRGVSVVDSEFAHTRLDDGRFAAYVVQPIVPKEDLLIERLAEKGDEEADKLLRRLVENVSAAVDDSTGIDAQVSNWAIEDGDLWYFDVSTPLMRDPEGRYLLDVDIFLASLPAALRAPVKHFVADSMLQTYFDPRACLVDVAANFYKDGIDKKLPIFLKAAADRVSPPITKREVLAYHRRDVALWSTLQRARRLDRWWQRTVRRRVYPYLLPPTVYAGRKTERRR